MPSLRIRKLPEDIYWALKNAAERERRSLSQQAIIALAKGLEVPIDFRERRKQVLAEIQGEVHLWENYSEATNAAWKFNHIEDTSRD